MYINSRFDGKCELCGERYEKGDEIWWEPGTKAVHRECHEDENIDKINEKSPIKPVQKGVTVRYKGPKCEACGQPIVGKGCAGTGLCTPCATGDASTAGEFDSHE